MLNLRRDKELEKYIPYALSSDLCFTIIFLVQYKKPCI